MTAGQEPDRPDSDRYDPLVFLAIKKGLRGVRNEYLVKKLQFFGLQVTAVHGEVERLSRCPCCHYKSLAGRGSYDICPVCFWEDDGSDDPNHYSLPNGMRLEEAQSNFHRCGASSERARPSVDPDGSLKNIRDH